MDAARRFRLFRAESDEPDAHNTCLSTEVKHRVSIVVVLHRRYMNRRQVLQQLAAGSILLTTGCTAIFEKPSPFHFAIVNRREQHYHVEFTVRDDSDNLLIDGSVDIASRSFGDEEEYSALDFPNITQVTNGDIINAQVQIAGETFEETFEVTCNRSENAENNLFFQIRHEDASTLSEPGMEFAGSEC